jgi:hypothetical protein
MSNCSLVGMKEHFQLSRSCNNFVAASSRVETRRWLGMRSTRIAVAVRHSLVWLLQNS